MQELTTKLFEFQKSGYLCDTLIIAADGTVKAHGAVLAAASPVFEQALKSSCQLVQHTVVLPGIQLVVVNVIIRFIYTGKLIVPKDKHCIVTSVIATLLDLRIKLRATRYLYVISTLCIYLSGIALSTSVNIPLHISGWSPRPSGPRC